MATTFEQKEPEHLCGYEYGALGNPTRDSLETCLASLENSKYALCFSSGMGAITSLSCLLKSGDHVLAMVKYHQLKL